MVRHGRSSLESGKRDGIRQLGLRVPIVHRVNSRFSDTVLEGRTLISFTEFQSSSRFVASIVYWWLSSPTASYRLLGVIHNTTGLDE